MNRPCIGCGTVITSGSRCQDCKLPDRPRTRTTAHAGSDWRWRKLSARMRKLSPFCEKCGSKNKSSLTVDHVIPVSDDATLAYEPLNLRVYCQSCNASRSTNVTDNERAAVYAAIQARKQRQARYYASEVGKTAQRGIDGSTRIPRVMGWRVTPKRSAPHHARPANPEIIVTRRPKSAQISEGALCTSCRRMAGAQPK